MKKTYRLAEALDAAFNGDDADVATVSITPTATIRDATTGVAITLDWEGARAVLRGLACVFGGRACADALHG